MSSLHMFYLAMQIAFSSLSPFAFATIFLNTPVEEFRIYLNESFSGQLTIYGYDSLWNIIQNIWLVGLLIGMILSPVVNDRFGRRVGLLSGNIVNLVLSIVQWTAVHFYSPVLLLSARFISSIVTAITFQSVILYLQEFPPSAKRGTSSYTSDITYSFSCFVVMTLGTKQLLGDHLSVLMGVNVAFCLLSVLFTIRIHESPKYLLITRGDEAAARHSIAFFHGADSSESAEQFVEELRAEGRAEENSAHSFKDVITIFTDPVLRKTVLLGLATLEMIIPLWTLLFFSTELLLDLHASKFVAQWTSSGMVVCYFVGTCIGILLIDKLGRRSLFIPCSAISTSSIALFTLSFYLKPTVPRAEFIAVGSLLISGLAFGIGITSPAWFIPVELSPQRYRGLIQSVTAVLNTIQSTIFTFSVTPLYRLFGPWIFLIIFCLVTALCNLFLFLELPETKGRPISEITEELRNVSARRNKVAHTENTKMEEL